MIRLSKITDKHIDVIYSSTYQDFKLGKIMRIIDDLNNSFTLAFHDNKDNYLYGKIEGISELIEILNKEGLHKSLKFVNLKS